MNKKVPKISAKIVEITPVVAAERLSTCKVNRNLNKKHVNGFVRLIQQGRFRDYGLIFANGDGKFHDSQHRLSALVQTGHTAKFVVVTGLDEEDMAMMVDSGRKRTTSQRLASLGYSNSGLLVSAVEECLELTQHWKRKASMVFPDEVVAYIEANPDLSQTARRWASATVHGIPTKYIVADQHLFSKIDSLKADEFFLKLSSRRDLVKDGDPLHAFFEMLQSVEVTSAESNKRNVWIKNGLIIAWNAFLKDGKLDKIVPTNRVIPIEGLVTEEPAPVQEEVVESEEEETEEETEESSDEGSDEASA